MPKTTHLCMNIRGFMRNHSFPRGYRDVFTNTETGKPLTPHEAREYLFDCLAKGWRVIPLDSSCEGFDYQTGCPGHEQAAPDA